MNCIDTDWDSIKNSFMAQKKKKRISKKKWFSSVSHLNEEIKDAFIENDADGEII